MIYVSLTTFKLQNWVVKAWLLVSGRRGRAEKASNAPYSCVCIMYVYLSSVFFQRTGFLLPWRLRLRRDLLCCQGTTHPHKQPTHVGWAGPGTGPPLVGQTLLLAGGCAVCGAWPLLLGLHLLDKWNIFFFLSFFLRCNLQWVSLVFPVLPITLGNANESPQCTHPPMT